MKRLQIFFQQWWVWPLVVAVGLVARLALATRGHNYDMESYYLVADIAHHGGNVYMETKRYNYGPAWYLVLKVLDVLAGHRHEVLRYLIAGFLSLVDLGIFVFISQQVGRLAAALFFLNPISIIISGYHCQFDNLAILLGLWAVSMLGDDFQGARKLRAHCGLVLLGLSLVTKHLFFLFPLWLAIKQRNQRDRLIIVSVPAICFLASFAPFLVTGWDGVLNHVFLYYPPAQRSIYDLLLPKDISYQGLRTYCWISSLIAAGIICKRKGNFEAFLIYTGVLTAFSPTVSNQYFAIPVVFIAVFPNWFFFAYTLISTIHLCGDEHGLQLFSGRETYFGTVASWVLVLAVVWHVYRGRIIEATKGAHRKPSIPGRQDRI